MLIVFGESGVGPTLSITLTNRGKEKVTALITKSYGTAFVITANHSLLRDEEEIDFYKVAVDISNGFKRVIEEFLIKDNFNYARVKVFSKGKSYSIDRLEVSKGTMYDLDVIKMLVHLYVSSDFGNHRELDSVLKKFLIYE